MVLKGAIKNEMHPVRVRLVAAWEAGNQTTASQTKRSGWNAVHLMDDVTLPIRPSFRKVKVSADESIYFDVRSLTPLGGFRSYGYENLIFRPLSE